MRTSNLRARGGPAPPGLAVAIAMAFLPTPALRPAEADTLFGLVDTGEVFASSDQGITWAPLATVPVSDAIAVMALSTPSDLVMATRRGTVLASPDAGATWGAVGVVPAADIVDLAVSAVGDLLMITETGTLHASTDGGATFVARAALTGSDFTSLCVPPSGRVYALARTGAVHESIDDGSTWATVGAITVPDAACLRAVDDDLFALTATGTVLESVDSGVTWSAISTLSQVGATSLVPVPGTGLVAATREGHVAVSADGTSWAWQGSINQLEVVGLGTDTPMGLGVSEVEFPPSSVSVSAPWPNPRRGAGGLSLRFALGRSESVVLTLFDVAGRRVASRPPEHFSSEEAHRVYWNPGHLSAGVYLVQLETLSGAKTASRWVVAD